MSAHKHAALMALYAQDAMETDKPWERWEFSDTEGFWATCGGHPVWNIGSDYRRKPRTIRIGEYDVPEPVREMPKHRTMYWVAGPTECDYQVEYIWTGNSIDQLWFLRGLIHLTREAAELHGKALISLTKI